MKCNGKFELSSMPNTITSADRLTDLKLSIIQIDGRKVFQDFLRCEYSEENILFWTACEELKKERDSKSIAAKARDIYEDYISILSSKEVSVLLNY